MSDRRLPSYALGHPMLDSNGLSMAMYIGDFKRLAQAAGFPEPRLLYLMQQTPADPEAQVNYVLGWQFYLERHSHQTMRLR